MDLDVAIIGGGIGGLALGWRLQQLAPAGAVRIFEADARPGGKLLSERIETEHGAFLVESGPDALLTQKPEALALAEELGLSDQLIPIASGLPTALLRKGQPVLMPEGMRLIVPTKPGPFLKSPLMSLPGKIRALRETTIPRRKGDGDESIADFVSRRFGQEAVEQLAEPILAGIHNGEPESLSMRATFPQLIQLEKQFGSLINGMRTLPTPAASGNPMFVAFRDGMDTLSRDLASRLHAKIAPDHRVVSITAIDGGYRLRFSNGAETTTRYLALTIPAAESASLVRELAPDLAERLDALRSVGAGSIAVAYPTTAVTRPLPGYGLVIPRSEHRPINAVTIASLKFTHRAPEGWSLFRLFFGGARSQPTMQLSENELMTMVSQQMNDLFGITEAPLFHRIATWPAGSPQYDVGHLDRVAAISAALPPGLFLNGSAYHGVGIPDVVRGANGLAAHLTSGA